MNTEIKNFCTRQNLIFRENFEIKKVSHIKTGGTAELIIYPNSATKLQSLIRFLKQSNFDYLIVGNFSNILFRMGTIKTVLISLQKYREITLDNNILSVSAGVMLPTVSKLIAEKGLSGFSGLYGVPASIGGALYMNASCYDNEVSDLIVDVDIIDGDGNFRTLMKNDISFSWRKSSFQDIYSDCIIVNVRFELAKSDPNQELERINFVEAHRKQYQENSLPNLGSVFATLDIYSEIAKNTFYFWGIKKLVSLYSKCFGKRRDIVFAKLMVKITKYLFFRNTADKESISEKTINCLVNTGYDSNSMIHLVYYMQKKLKLDCEIELVVKDQIR